MDVAVGKFYRFKPRNAWPPSLQQSIPEDKLYFTHPVIVIAVPPPGSAGIVEVVHTTSSPNLTSNLPNYLPISHNMALAGDGNPNMPLCVNANLPKDSWVVLDSRRRLSVTILEPWIERGIHFKLGKQSRKRLVQKVDDRMKALGLPQRPQPQSAPSQVQVRMAPARVVATTSPKSEKSLNIQDIKNSLAGLKVAVSALEGLCEKLEARAEEAGEVAAAPTEGSAQPQISNRNLNVQGSDASPSAAADVEVANAHGRVEPKLPSKVSRLKKWSSKIFRTEDQW